MEVSVFDSSDIVKAIEEVRRIQQELEHEYTERNKNPSLSTNTCGFERILALRKMQRSGHDPQLISLLSAQTSHFLPVRSNFIL